MIPRTAVIFFSLQKHFTPFAEPMNQSESIFEIISSGSCLNKQANNFQTDWFPCELWMFRMWIALYRVQKMLPSRDPSIGNRIWRSHRLPNFKLRLKNQKKTANIQNQKNCLFFFCFHFYSIDKVFQFSPPFKWFEYTVIHPHWECG